MVRESSYQHSPHPHPTPAFFCTKNPMLEIWEECVLTCTASWALSHLILLLSHPPHLGPATQSFWLAPPKRTVFKEGPLSRVSRLTSTHLSQLNTAFVTLTFGV